MRAALEATLDGTAFVDSWAGMACAPPNANFALAAMPPTTPRRALLTTGNHGSPTNAYDSARVDEESAVVRVRLRLDTKGGGGWVEIDAVGLLLAP